MVAAISDDRIGCASPLHSHAIRTSISPCKQGFIQLAGSRFQSINTFLQRLLSERKEGIAIDLYSLLIVSSSWVLRYKVKMPNVPITPPALLAGPVDSGSELANHGPVIEYR